MNLPSRVSRPRGEKISGEKLSTHLSPRTARTAVRTAIIVSIAAWKGRLSQHTLRLSRDEFGEGGARALAEALRSEACTLHTLILFGRDMGEGGARALAAALETGPCLLESIKGAPRACEVLLIRRRRRFFGLLRAAVALAVARKRAAEVVFHPARLKQQGVFDASLEEDAQRVRTTF